MEHQEIALGREGVFTLDTHLYSRDVNCSLQPLAEKTNVGK